MATVLVADDDAVALEATRGALATVGHVVLTASSATEASSALTRSDVDVVLSEIGTAEPFGVELCRRVAGNRPDIPVILMSGDSRVEHAVAAIRAGAFDFLTKPLAMPALYTAVERAVRHGSLQRRIRALRRDEVGEEAFDDMVGRSPSMREVFDLIQRVADSESSVLVVGASGTGKELVARALHARSRRREGKFLALNCATLSETMLDTELFGRADPARSPGLFAQAQGGTLFLDEIDEMPLGLQPKLLRALQEQVSPAPGSKGQASPDVRLVAATHHDLELAIEERRFRSDLFFRLNVVQIAMPSLHARGGDVLLLAEHFLERFAARDAKPILGISAAVAERLFAYDWPGNVRELQSTMEHAVALGRYDEVGLDDLPKKIRLYAPVLGVPPVDLAAPLTLHEVSRRYIVQVLAMADGNKTVAARWLGIDRKTLYRRLARTEENAALV